MKFIPLTQGFSAKVDDSDYEWLSKFNWHYAHGYAMRCQRIEEVSQGAKKKKVFMHLDIFGTAERLVDHEDGDKLNNQRRNLRPANRQQNQANAFAQRSRSSKFKGVCWAKRSAKWYAYIMVDYRHRSLGYYKDEIEAARAYDTAALKHFGQYARINFDAGMVQQ